MTEKKYGFETILAGATLPAAEAQVAAALKEEGFGVLTRIDVQETLKKKIDVDFRPYVILGACNPRLAHRALEADAQVGLLLPCNVVLQADPAGVRVSIVDPLAMLAAADRPDVQPVAAEAEQKLRRVLARIA